MQVEAAAWTLKQPPLPTFCCTAAQHTDNSIPAIDRVDSQSVSVVLQVILTLRAQAHQQQRRTPAAAACGGRTPAQACRQSTLEGTAPVMVPHPFLFRASLVRPPVLLLLLQLLMVGQMTS